MCQPPDSTIVQLYLSPGLFVDTTGLTMEHSDLPQAEKLHHYLVLSKHGYMWGSISPTFVVIGIDYKRRSNYNYHVITATAIPLAVSVDFQKIEKHLEDYFMKWKTLASYLSTPIVIGQDGNKRIDS